MSDLIAHPLTGGGAYTADMYRKVVNASITPSDGTPFGALQGIRAGAASPLVETDGLKAIIHPHAGWINPWNGVGAYSYAILDDTEIDFESSSQNYKLALVLDDPSQGHGSTPQLTARIYPAATSDTTIPGIVIATITNGTANDTAPILLPQALLMARDKTQLDTITATEGQKAKTLDDDTEYLYRDGAWVSLTQTMEWKPPYTTGRIRFERRGSIVMVNGNVKFDSSGDNQYSTANETLPYGWRPIGVNTPIQFHGAGCTFSCLFGDPNGKCVMVGNPNSSYATASGTWMTDDDVTA